MNNIIWAGTDVSRRSGMAYAPRNLGTYGDGDGDGDGDGNDDDDDACTRKKMCGEVRQRP